MNADQAGGVIAAAVISPLVVIIVAMVLIAISYQILIQLYTRKYRNEIRIIKFTTSKTSSLTDVLQIFKVYYITCIMYTQH